MSLGHLATCALGVDAQRAGAAAGLASITGAGHVAAPLVELGAVDLRAAEALARVFCTSDGETAAVAESHACFVGHLRAVEVGPLRERSWEDGVGEAAGVRPCRVGRGLAGRWRRRWRWRRGGGRGGRWLGSGMLVGLDGSNVRGSVFM
jgi:hypothetical protein